MMLCGCRSSPGYVTPCCPTPACCCACCCCTTSSAAGIGPYQAQQTATLSLFLAALLIQQQKQRQKLQLPAPTSGPAAYQLASASSSLLTLSAEPFLAAGDPVAKQQLAHMAEFGLAYLAASHLIDAEGRPVGLAGLVSHLFWTEPANLALVRLLSSGAVHRLVAEVKGQQQLQEALLLMIAGLFERVPLHPLEARRWQGSRRHESASVVSHWVVHTDPCQPLHTCHVIVCICLCLVTQHCIRQMDVVRIPYLSISY